MTDLYVRMPDDEFGEEIAIGPPKFYGSLFAGQTDIWCCSPQHVSECCFKKGLGQGVTSAHRPVRGDSSVYTARRECGSGAISPQEGPDLHVHGKPATAGARANLDAPRALGVGWTEAPP